MKKAVFFDIDGTLLDHFGGIVDITPNGKQLELYKKRDIMSLFQQEDHMHF